MRKSHFYIVMILIMSAILFPGCAAITQGFKGLIGISTLELEKGKKDATGKVFNYDMSSSYSKVERALKNMSHVSIYANEPKKRLIAIYYTDINTTSVGIFFEEAGPVFTKIEVYSPSPNVQKHISNELFSTIDKIDDNRGK